VTAVEVLPAAIVVAQIDAVASDLRPAATKMGMLASVDIVRATAVAIARHRLPNIVLDTVMVAKGGARLISDAAVAAMREQLLPLADLVTPNVPEAEALTGLTIRSVDDMRLAARQIADLGAKAVLLKGGHLEGAATDVLLTAGRIVELSASRIDTRHTHGTGCTLSAAIAARLALGDGLEDAVRAAKQYVTVAIRQAPSLGAGHGPLQHFPKLP
jgi:hydroxymethylpyrimidine/phosphomethylpyrimidine kinase